MPGEARVPRAEIKRLVLEADGREIPVNDFVKDMLGSVVLAAVRTLKGVGDPRQVMIRVER